jgi:hypothetical protein
MKWLYYIPHTWEDREGKMLEKVCWEDLYLMPDITECHKSIWLTVDGYYPEDTTINGLPWEATWFENEAEKELFLKQGFLIRDEQDMVVKDPEFTKEELLEWAKLFLREIGFTVSELVEAPVGRFAGSNQHVRAVDTAVEAMREFELDPEAHSISLDELEEELKDGDSR